MTNLAAGWEALPLIGPPGPEAELALVQLEERDAVPPTAAAREHAAKEYAHLAHRARQRGGEVALGLEGTIGVAPHAYVVKVEVATFVRDVVRQSKAPAAAPKR